VETAVNKSVLVWLQFIITTGVRRVIQVRMSCK
jgi:hypothetical protein